MSEVHLPALQSSALVPVTAAVHPLTMERVLSHVEVGRHISEVVQKLCPIEYVGSLVVSIDGEDVPRETWDTRRVGMNDIIVLRAVPQGSGNKLLRSILMLAVIAVAFAVLGPAGAFGVGTGLFAAGTVGASVLYGVAFAAINLIGHMLINALIPPASIGNSNGNGAQTQTFGISGIQNSELPYGVVPKICGRTIMTPPKGAHSYTVIQTNDSYLYGLFDLGPGPIAISNIKIGQTPIDSFQGVQYEVREGRPSDAAITLYTNKVSQQALSIALNAQGTAVTQRTPINTSHIEVDIANPGGLFMTDDKGNFVQTQQSFSYSVQRVSDAFSVASGSIAMSGRTTSTVAQTTTVFDGVADQYDVLITRSDGQPDAKKGSAKAYWSALRTWSPLTGPLLPQNHAKIAVKIKATEQLNGDISNLNCIAQAYVQVWDGTAFSEQLNTHPAWAAYSVMTASANARPLNQSRIDVNTLKLWADTYPSAEFNYVFSGRSTIWQALRTIGSAGRAQPVIRDGIYSFIFDRTQDSPVQMFTARNVKDFKATKQFLDEVQGLEVRYVSETMGWQQNSVFCYASGYDATNVDGNRISTLNLTGVTSDDWARKLGSYFFAQAVLRPTTYQFSTDLDHLACNPGDRIWVQHDVITSGVATGRITSVNRSSGNIISILTDETLTGDGVSNYILRVRSALGGLRNIPVSIPANVAGRTFTLLTALDDTADPIVVGDLTALSTVEQGMLDGVVKTISPGPDFKAIVSLLDYAPAVHNGDAVVYAPLTNTRVNTFLFPQKTASIVIDSLTSGENDAITIAGGWLVPRIHGHFTVNQDGYMPDIFEVQWQKQGDTGWQSISPVGGATREFYINISYQDKATAYNVRARGNTVNKRDPSDWSNASLQLTDFAILPDPPTTLTVTPIIGGAIGKVTAGAGVNPSAYRLYAGTSTFAAASLVDSGPASTLTATGLTIGTPYLFWATVVNGAGLESFPVGPVAAVPLPLGYNDLSTDITDFLNFQGNAMRDAQEAISQLSQTAATLALGGYTDVQQIRVELHSATGALTADYTNLITVATGPSSSLVTNVTALQAALTGYTGGSAVANAFTSTNANVTTVTNALTGYTGASAVATAFTTVNAQVGNSYASGLFRVSVQSTPSGADARIALQVAASSGGAAYTASIFLDARTGGGSRITMVADKIFMTDGTGNTAPFFFSGGTLNISNAVIQNLTAGSILTGTLTTLTLDTNAATDNVGQLTGATSLVEDATGLPLSFNTWTSIAAATVLQVNSYAPIIVSMFGAVSYQSGTQGQLNARLVKDGTVISYFPGPSGLGTGDNIGAYYSYSWNIMDTFAAAGSHVYTLQVATNTYGVTGNTGPPYYTTTYGHTGSQTQSDQGSINVIAFKR